MCTIAVMRGIHPAFPLIVAANRDEFYARAATPPAAVDTTAAGDIVVAGTDGFAGGTWMGATARGFFAGVTNQRTGNAAHPGRRSRGELVRIILRAGSADAATRALEALDPGAYNPCNLLYGDAADLRAAYLRDDPTSLEVVALEPGAHVLANDRLGSAHFPKTAVAIARLDLATLGSLDAAALQDRLRRMLIDHEIPEATPDPLPGSLFTPEIARRLQALCIHTPVYGTVSSTTMLLRERSVASYRYAPGSPCVTDFVDVTRAFA